jgi:NAD(P)-dependent dehydrogenase (short-subunit alcohol dehydrogenase family)
MTAPQQKVWLVTGVSSGFGRELARAALKRGYTVLGTMRQESQRAEFEAMAPGRAHARLLDVTQAATIPKLVSEVIEKFGNIDVLVNNAGYGLMGAVEELDDAESRRVLETNFFGTLNMVRAVLPHFRSRRAGHIVNMSSIAGLLGIAGVGLYCASKFAVTGLSESLAQELAPFGIRVTVVEPGGFRTNFAGGSMTLAKKLMTEYDGTPAATPRGMREHYHGKEPGDPAKAAAAIITAVESPKPPLHLLLGPDALQYVRHKLAAFGEDISAWESVTSGTSYDSEARA